MKGAVKLPYALSILAAGSPNGEVMGLDLIPRELWPPLVIHYFFDGMVAIGMYMLVVPLLYFAVRRWKKGNVPRPLLHAIFWGAPLSILAIELGWIFRRSGGSRGFSSAT